jgi:phosphoribosyl 1,2-cyclic phosphodiesterase
LARFSSLYSGSSGNSVAIGCGGKYLLIDAGKSAKKIRERLRQEDIAPDAIAAIFVTHEHTDHIAGVRVLASSLKIPVYATEGTAAYLDSHGHAANVDLRVMPSDGVDMGEMAVTAFATSHDAAESCGFSVHCCDGRKITLATDTGIITPEIYQALCGADLVYLESNHDTGMLYAGAYPYPLKKRIASDVGHLSNEVCSAELPLLARSGTTRFILGHLSAENNMPLLARQSAVCECSKYGLREGVDYLLSVAPPDGLKTVVF